MGKVYGVPIELGGRSRRLRFDMNALSDLETALGRSVAEVLSGDGQSLGFAAMRALVWAGLKHEDRGLTLERAGSMMQQAIDDGGTIADILGKVSEAITACGVFSGEKAGDSPADPPATA
jgi:hypothetical protein